MSLRNMRASCFRFLCVFQRLPSPRKFPFLVCLRNDGFMMHKSVEDVNYDLVEGKVTSLLMIGENFKHSRSNSGFGFEIH